LTPKPNLKPFEEFASRCKKYIQDTPFPLPVGYTEGEEVLEIKNRIDVCFDGRESLGGYTPGRIIRRSSDGMMFCIFVARDNTGRPTRLRNALKPKQIYLSHFLGGVEVLRRLHPDNPFRAYFPKEIAKEYEKFADNDMTGKYAYYTQFYRMFSVAVLYTAENYKPAEPRHFISASMEIIM